MNDESPDSLPFPPEIHSEHVRRSDEIGELAAALAKAQFEIKDPLKDQTNPFFTTAQRAAKYADLAGVLSEVRPSLSKHGIALVQLPIGGTGWKTIGEGKDRVILVEVGLESMLMHSSGQWISTRIWCTAYGKNPSQQTGIVITYLRRYTAAAMAGIAQTDDDGNDQRVDTVPDHSPDGKTRSSEKVSSKIAPEDLSELQDKIGRAEVDIPRFLEHFSISVVEELEISDLDRAHAMLDAKLRKNSIDQMAAESKSGSQPD